MRQMTFRGTLVFLFALIAWIGTAAYIVTHGFGAFSWPPRKPSLLLVLIPFVALAGLGVSYLIWPAPVIRRGCCERCGYDLRGLTERRCPECGNEF